MPHAKKSFPFLSLTRELRDQIYDSLLLDTRTPPQSPEQADAYKYLGAEDERCFEYCNRYPAEKLQNTTTPFQLACRQVRGEIREAISRLAKSKSLPYKLDLMILDEKILYPTWLAFPAMITAIPRLEVDVRCFGDVGGKRSALRSRDAGPGPMIWSLLGLMRRFLLRGPLFLPPEHKPRYQWIEELAVNVRSPSTPPPNGYAARYGGFSNLRRKGLVEPEHLISCLIFMMDYLLRRNRHTASYAALTFERIQRMTFTLDGEVRRTWDLGTLEPEYMPDVAS
ncbi:MAG: hypothetical protein L6R39_005355 [Caloplaca ligustica]|nr:MAG: hypothetical protein L6R39_005355 [Caloplaca ligustica]